MSIKRISCITLSATILAAMTACTSLSTSQQTNQTASSPAITQTASTQDWYRTQVGNLQIIALSAGTLMNDNWFDGQIDPAHYDALLEKAGVSKQAGAVPTAISSFLIDDGERLILIDAADAMSGTPERLVQALAHAGVSADKITAILLTHAHPDHITALHDSQGKPQFANATLYVSEYENITNPVGYTVNLQGYKVQTFADGETLLGNVTTIPLKGHTAGHTGFGLMAKGGERVLFVGDIIHGPAVQFARPDVTANFDANKAQAVSSRLSLLGQVADQPILIAGSHLDFPSLGYVKRSDTAYAWQGLK